MNIKQEVLNIVNALPEGVQIEEIMYKLYVLEKIHTGQNAIKNDDKCTAEELKKEIQNW